MRKRDKSSLTKEAVEYSKLPRDWNCVIYSDSIPSDLPAD